MSPATVVTFFPMKAAASFSSFSRRPVITTCAPSSTKRLAVAKPIPLLPPVINAIFPANFCPLLLLICFFLFCFSLFLNVEFTLFLQSSHSHRLLLLLEQILRFRFGSDPKALCQALGPTREASSLERLNDLL